MAKLKFLPNQGKQTTTTEIKIIRLPGTGSTILQRMWYPDSNGQPDRSVPVTAVTRNDW